MQADVHDLMFAISQATEDNRELRIGRRDLGGISTTIFSLMRLDTITLERWEYRQALNTSQLKKPEEWVRALDKLVQGFKKGPK